MRFVTLAATAVAAISLSAVAAHATVVSFDDLTGTGTVADGYGGIIWGGNWNYYDAAQDPYNPASLYERVYTNYDLHTSGALEDVGFKFAAPVVFDGAFFSGGYSPGVSFKLYNGGSLVATSGVLNQTSTPTWLASGYSGSVDEVRVSGYNGYYVMDDVTYNGGAVPEPATWAMMIAGFGLAGAALRRRRIAFAA